MDKQNIEDSNMDRPTPADFDIYLPWACKQLQLGASVQVTKIYQNEYVSVALTDRSKKGKSRGKLLQSRVEITEQEDHSTSAISTRQVYEKNTAKIVRVLAIYDIFENLVQIKFEKNNHLPRVMIKVLGLIIQFQNYLYNITINGGLDQYTVYEISQFLPASHITEICLDDCSLKEPNYHLLLTNSNVLKYLSLCRCKIDDFTVESICSLLIYPMPASKSLSILHLASNRITDEGAKFIANALRSNRQLSYLNLASNMITDKGATAILDILTEFHLTSDEVLAAKTRKMTYLKSKNDMIALAIRDLQQGDGDKKSVKRKSMRPASTVPKKLKADKDTSQKSLVDPGVKSIADIDSVILEKAITIVENAIGNFEDPFNSANTIVRNGITYCKGNNFICCLNLSFNYLSYLTLRKLQSVLVYQKLADRKPRGLVSILVEGNIMPNVCKELSQIDNILEINLIAQTRRMSTKQKRPQSKNQPRRFDIQ